jgi:hypothetical protein
MNRRFFAFFFYYAEFIWHEVERMYELIINAQIKKGRFTLCYGIPIRLWGRRCNRRFIRRGRQPGNNEMSFE